MEDLVERLRAARTWMLNHRDWMLCQKAADEVERLRNAYERLKKIRHDDQNRCACVFDRDDSDEPSAQCAYHKRMSEALRWRDVLREAPSSIGWYFCLDSAKAPRVYYFNGKDWSGPVWCWLPIPELPEDE